MTELDELIIRISQNFPQDGAELTIEQARAIIREINEFLYTNYEGIGFTQYDRNLEYFSSFHKYWEMHHREILNIQTDRAQCEKVADALHDVFVRTNGNAFTTVYDTYGLSMEEVCKIRLLTANQDFRGSRSFGDLVEIYRADNSVFDLQYIYDNPEDFIKNIGITELSQSDKRIQYAKNIAKFFIDNQCEPYAIIDKYNRDVVAFKNALTSLFAGYGNKKADMFIRDMVILGAWTDVINFENINVASDVNTIKVALRTGILRSAIPLVSSFIDIFCYQYGYTDDMNARAWREVWSIWREKYPTESIDSPCMLDYFIYNVVGRQFCKEILYVFQGDTCDHRFAWHSSRNKTCQVCYQQGTRGAKAHVVMKKMPCLDDEGYIAICNTQYVRENNANPNFTECPFRSICTENQTVFLMPPKSISIEGQTGWRSAYTRKRNGGGGLMA